MCTHIRHKHIKICILCCLCKKKSYSSTTISLHLKTIHPHTKSEWFELTPALEGDTNEVPAQVLAANLAEIDAVKEEHGNAE